MTENSVSTLDTIVQYQNEPQATLHIIETWTYFLDTSLHFRNRADYWYKWYLFTFNTEFVAHGVLTNMMLNSCWWHFIRRGDTSLQIWHSIWYLLRDNIVARWYLIHSLLCCTGSFLHLALLAIRSDLFYISGSSRLISNVSLTH